MGHKTAVALILALAAVAGPAPAGLNAQGVRQGGPPSVVRGTSSIVGRIINPTTNTPVRGAQVSAVHRAGVVTAVTDETGIYRLERLAAGEWRVTASKGGYISWQYGQRRPFQPPPPIRLEPDQQYTADIPLTRGGAIAGRVVDEFGGPLAGLHVRAYRTKMERGVRRVQPVAAADFTDDTGSFRLYGLPPGDYYVAASMRVAPVGTVVETTYSPTYYPGTPELAEAQRIRLDLGQEANVAFPLQPLRRVRVSGMVLASSGSPADAFLNLESEASEFGVPIGIGGVTRSDGSFTLADVPPGRYRLTATLRGDGPDESGALPLTVYGEDVAGATVVTGRAATLAGTIVAANAVRRLPANLVVVAVSARAGGNVLGSGEGPSFDIDGLSEPFYLTIDEIPETWMITAITVNGENVLGRPVDLAPGQEAEARIELTDRVTEVVGSVDSDTAGAHAVVIFPEDSTRWTGRSIYLRRTQTDGSGRFRVAGLPTGSRYLAVAVTYLDEGEHMDPDFLPAMQPAATPFSLEESDRGDITVRLVER